VQVDQPGQQDQPARVQPLRPRRVQARADLGDQAVTDQDVGRITAP